MAAFVSGAVPVLGGSSFVAAPAVVSARRAVAGAAVRQPPPAPVRGARMSVPSAGADKDTNGAPPPPPPPTTATVTTNIAPWLRPPRTPLKRRDDIKKIMVIGAGPIVIGQACEFDYSGTQACKALREEGFTVVLVNSNPASIMTDPETADRTYVEPLTPATLEAIMAAEKPDAILPTMGGQTALNLATTLAESGALERHGVELIGAKLDAIAKGEDRLLFREAMERIGVPCCPSGIATTVEEAEHVADNVIGTMPLIVRPAYTLGGTGGGIAYNKVEFMKLAAGGLAASPTTQIMVEQSLLGWKEYELEVVRDGADNVVIVCGIENFDPMGVHTGDSITVAPTQTLTDKEYQRLRDYSIAIIREIGVDTGGSNIQFSVNPKNGDVIVIEMNPRVSRSSALASKATGFPIAKLAAKLSCGIALPELKNDITLQTPACFEPTLDYVVVKVPRFAFEKFPGASDVLSTQMRAVGEVMAMGRTFLEAFQKALRSMETGRFGWCLDGKDKVFSSRDELEAALRVPTPERVYYIYSAFAAGLSVEEIFDLSAFDPWFLYKLQEIVELAAEELSTGGGAAALASISAASMQEIKAAGFSDRQIAHILGGDLDEATVRQKRKALGIVPVFKTVDTCAAEFEAYTPYLYSSYESTVWWDSPDDADDDAGASSMEVGNPASRSTETPPSTGKRKVVILGGGPNRIGQGIEFDMCCCHGLFALRDAGIETVMINSNPETVSTDYDSSDRLYFEPLTLEDVIAVLEAERPDGVIVQFGGQTPLKLALGLEAYLSSEEAAAAGVTARILGTQPKDIDAAEDRDLFIGILKKLGITQPANGIARSLEEASSVAADIGFPVVVRPSYVLGGRGMEIVYTEAELARYMSADVVVESEHPVLIDRFLDNAIEVDVDAICDSTGAVVIGGIMEHIEQAGVHSGDSACSLPTVTIPYNAMVTIRSWTAALAKELNVVGLLNIQWAVQGEKVFILEANPRASRTVPFVSKAIGRPLAKVAALIMAGYTLAELNFTTEIVPRHVAVKEAVLPFAKFPGADILLSPEMRSTGEVMGLDTTFAGAFAKAQLAAGLVLPTVGTVFMSMNERDLSASVPLARDLVDLGFSIMATKRTHATLLDGGLSPDDVSLVLKANEGRPNVLDAIQNGEVVLYISSPSVTEGQVDPERAVRRAALSSNVPFVSTLAAARAIAQALRSLQSQRLGVKALQDYFPDYKTDFVLPGAGMPVREDLCVSAVEGLPSAV